MKILDRLPIPQVDTTAYVGAERVRLKTDQIIVWISISRESNLEWNPAALHFPAIVDTGHSHNFSIQNQHLVRWAGIQSGVLRRLGHVRHAGRRLPDHAARLWLHRNQPSTMAVSKDEPIFLRMLGGIAVYPDNEHYPRLPLLGLRAILSNRLHLTIDGARTSVTLRTPDWRTRLHSWLG